MRLAVLVTGGKDSALALQRILGKGHDIKYLVTVIPQRDDSWMFHYPNVRLTDLFAEAVGIPLVKGESGGIRESEIQDLRRVLSPLDIDGVVSGAISSEYQKKRIDQVCQDLGLESIAPLWQESPLKLIKEMVALGLNVIIVGVYALGFDRTWLGRKIDESAIRDLIELNRKFQVSIVGEGGEYETLVLDAPFFRKRIRLADKEKVWEKQSGYLLVKKAVLVDK